MQLHQIIFIFVCTKGELTNLKKRIIISLKLRGVSYQYKVYQMTYLSYLQVFGL